MEIPMQIPSVPFWQEHALDDPTLIGIQLPADLAEIFRVDAERTIEWSGYLIGVMRNGIFTVCSRTDLCLGKVRSFDGIEHREVSVHPRPHLNRVYDACEAQLLLHALPGAKAVLYHCHPRTGEEVLRKLSDGDADPIVASIAEDLDLGVYDYLGAPTLDDAINEAVSRHLSQDDIDLTFGNAHLLITNTPVPGHPLAHLNPYRLDGPHREPQLLRVSTYDPKTDEYGSRLKKLWYAVLKHLDAHFEKRIMPLLEDHELIPSMITDERLEQILKAAPPVGLLLRLVEMEGVEPSSGRPGTQPSTCVVPLLERKFFCEAEERFVGLAVLSRTAKRQGGESQVMTPGFDERRVGPDAGAQGSGKLRLRDSESRSCNALVAR